MKQAHYQIERAKEILLASQQAVAFTGAGISTPSGIPDFRSPGSGMWQSVDAMEVASIYSFRRRPQDFYEWISPVAQLIHEAEPNVAHNALAYMEEHGPLQAVITQNIDALHTKAGSKSVFEVHGHLREAICLRCYTIHPANSHMESLIMAGAVPHCESCGGVLKPNAILYGEQLPVSVMNKATSLAKNCDLMLVAGSSLSVAPAGDLPMLAAASGARLIIVNLEPTHADRMADVVIHADVVDILPELATVFKEV